MQTRWLLRLIAAALAAALPGQSCVNPCISSHWGAPLLTNAQFLPTTVALRVAGLPQADTVCQIEFFCKTRNNQPVVMPVWIYDRSPSGAPQTQLSSGSMYVGTTAGAYTASVQAALPANTDFFIVFDNAVGNLTPPVTTWGSYGATPQEHWHTGPSWFGPFFSAQYIYQVYCSTGTVQGTFATQGQGCPGSNGVPAINLVGDPIIGEMTQVTLMQAPLTAPAFCVLGTVPASLPLDLAGAPGCVLEQQPIIVAGMTAGSTGAVAYPFLIPNNAAFVGLQVLTQWAVVDPGVNQLGLVFSKGGILTIGDF